MAESCGGEDHNGTEESSQTIADSTVDRVTSIDASRMMPKLPLGKCLSCLSMLGVACETIPTYRHRQSQAYGGEESHITCSI